MRKRNSISPNTSNKKQKISHNKSGFQDIDSDEVIQIALEEIK